MASLEAEAVPEHRAVAVLNPRSKTGEGGQTHEKETVCKRKGKRKTEILTSTCFSSSPTSPASAFSHTWLQEQVTVLSPPRPISWRGFAGHTELEAVLGIPGPVCFRPGLGPVSCANPHHSFVPALPLYYLSYRVKENRTQDWD